MLNKILVYILAFCFAAVPAFSEKKAGPRTLNKSSVRGDKTNMDVNNIDLPMENDGSTGDDGRGYYPNGTTLSFLFQGGIATTGLVNGELRASWMAKASLIQEFQPGRWQQDANDANAKWYVVNSSDGFSSQAYQDWADAVALGADFQDLDSNGVYDPAKDRPDMIADRIAWCVYNDGTNLSSRTPRLQTNPLGLEVQQLSFAFSRADALGDVVFHRYRFINPTDQDINDMVFSIWTDPDIGAAEDDLIGVDTVKSLGYIYNDQDDDSYGSNPPAFGIDFFQGPIVESAATDTAYIIKGPYFGVDTIPGWRNLPATSFMYYVNGDPILNDPNNVTIARNYQLGGLDAQGAPIDPTQWGVINPGGPPPNPRFFYSGNPDPDSLRGWIDNVPGDKRFLINTGPFELAAGDTQNIVVAYVVSQADDAISSLNAMKQTDVTAQRAYDANFFVAPCPPDPLVRVRTDDKEIELIIDLEVNGTFDYRQSDKLLNEQVFEGINVYQFRSDAFSNTVNGQENKRLIATFDLDNEYSDVFLRQRNGEWRKIFTGNDNLDPADYTDEGSAILRLRLTTDAFTNQPLVNASDYYYSVTAFSLNHPFLIADSNGAITGNEDNWLATTEADVCESSLVTNFMTIRPQSDENRPFRDSEAVYTGNRTFYDGRAQVAVVDRDALTGDTYSISFIDDGNYWKVTNSAGTLLADSLANQGDATADVELWNFPVIDGLSMQVYSVEDRIDSVGTAATEVWVSGRTLDSLTSGLDGGIDLARNFKPQLSNITRDQYIPVRVTFDTQNSSVGYRWRAAFFSDNLFIGPEDIFISAYDISDPDNERQLNICFNNPGAGLPLTNLNEIYIMTSTYDPANAYDGSAGTLEKFRDEAYLIMSLAPVDSIFQSNQFSLDVYPTFPNSEADVFTVNTGTLSAQTTQAEEESLLDRMKVVPNPYYGFSTYETSSDQPVIKFTHMTRQATVRIFNLAGQIVQVLNKNDDSNQLLWDLRNSTGLRVASGMYIAHIEVPGVGEKVLKFAIIQRQERIDRF